MADLLDLGWLPDAMVQSIVEFLRSLLVGAMNFMFNFGLKPLLTINPGIVTDAQMVAAWDDVFELSIALLPILIAAGLIVMPFTEDQEGTLWHMVARIVAVIVFIAISKPLFAFMIDASNGVTNALAPATFKMTFDADLAGSWGSTLGTGIQLLALAVAVPLMLIATILATLLLVLRQFLVVTVAVGAPFFAVLWYANWGPMKAISKFASTWLRMGVYALLVGPIIALVMRVFDVIATGGITSSGDIASFYTASALALIFPIILLVVIWKTIGWAGQPLGVDAAFTMTVAAAIAATGVGAVAVGAGAGSGAVSSASKSSADGASGSTSSGRSGSGGSGGGSAGQGVAIDPSAGTANSSVGGTMRSSISDALSTREPAVEDDVNSAPGLLNKKLSYAQQKTAGAPGVQATRNRINRVGTRAKRVGSKTKSLGLSGARMTVGSQSIDTHRKTIAGNLSVADEADANRDFLTEAFQNGELNVAEAADRGILTGTEQPTEEVSTVTPDAEGTVTYSSADGGEATVNINDRAQSFEQKAHALREDASKSARSVKRIRAAQTAARTPGRAVLSTGQVGKQVGNTGVQAGKVSGVIFAGAMTRSPYAAYQIGKRGGKHLIGPGADAQPADSPDDADIDWSTRRDGLGQATESPWDEDTRNEPSETV